MLRVSSRSPLPEASTKAAKRTKKVHFLEPTTSYGEMSTNEFIRRRLGKGKEPDAQDWKSLAKTFKCDAEALNETNMMGELLDLCSWWDDEEAIYLTTGTKTFIDSDSEDEEWLLNFQNHTKQLQSVSSGSKAKSTPMKPLASVTDLRLRSLLRLQSSSFKDFGESDSWASSSGINQAKHSETASSQATSGIFSSKISDEMEFAYQGIVCSDNMVRSMAKATHKLQQKPFSERCSIDDAFDGDIDF